MTRIISCLWLGVLLVNASAACSSVAAEVNLNFSPALFKSSSNQTSLIELYTSEGCSSCPPAEAWLSELKKSPDLWKTFVPVAFHVNYWDQLGWPDKFASIQFTDRQYSMAKSWKSASVYTPGFALQGGEWRWDHSEAFAHPSTRQVGVLKLGIDYGNKWRATFFPNDSTPQPYAVTIAMLGSDISVDVKRGENAGRKLDHDFIVLSLQSHALQKTNEGYTATNNLKLEPINRGSRVGVAAWVTLGDSLVPVQATGGWLSLNGAR